MFSQQDMKRVKEYQHLKAVGKTRKEANQSQIMITSIQPIILPYIKERCLSYHLRCRFASTQLGSLLQEKIQKSLMNNYDIAEANAPTPHNPIMHIQEGNEKF